jgi:hypothetical protein
MYIFFHTVLGKDIYFLLSRVHFLTGFTKRSSLQLYNFLLLPSLSLVKKSSFTLTSSSHSTLLCGIQNINETSTHDR